MLWFINIQQEELYTRLAEIVANFNTLHASKVKGYKSCKVAENNNMVVLAGFEHPNPTWFEHPTPTWFHLWCALGKLGYKDNVYNHWGTYEIYNDYRKLLK